MTFTSDTNKYIRSVKYLLEDADAPAIGALKALAKELDKGITAQLIGQYRLIYNQLQKRFDANSGPEDDDLFGTGE